MKTAQDIIIAPVITEKSMSANKIEIADAVAKLFKVDVAKVNTINVRGQARRMGRYNGYTAAWKKAIVTLKADSKPIEFFDGLI